MNSIPAFLTFLTLMWSILFFVHWMVYIPVARVFNVTIPHAILILIALSGTYFLASFFVRTVEYVVADWFYFVAASWLGTIFLLFSVMALYQLMHLATGFDSQLVVTLLLIFGTLLSIYALIAGRTLIVREYTVPVDKLDHILRVVHLSDIHVGTVHQTKYLKHVVAKVNDLEPDIVLITGDLFDGSARIDESILIPLNGLTAPSYFSNGNHEQYEGLQTVRTTLDHLDLHLLENEVVEEQGVQIIGVNDRQSLSRGTTLDTVLHSLALEDTKPSVLMYHTPSNWDTAQAHGIDLMLSGHTHNGQIAPFNLLVRLFFKYINGLYIEDGRALHVSPGTGTWGPPMRLGSRNQITLLVLEPR